MAENNNHSANEHFEPRSAHLEFFEFINVANKSIPSLNLKYYKMLLDMLIDLKECSLKTCKNKSSFECNFIVGKITFELY